MTATVDKKETATKTEPKKVDLEAEIKFSWKSVLVRWGQNLKDDIDPAVTGAKMGFLGLHGVPTWMRQYQEGKMSPDGTLLPGLLGLVVAGTFGTGYFLAGKEIAERTNNNLAGYAMIAVPLASQAISWTYEAFYRAKKTETSRVVMTRLQRTFDNPTTDGYHLTNHAFIDAIAANLYKVHEEEVNKRIKQQRESIAAARNGIGRYSNWAPDQREAEAQTKEEEIGKLEKDIQDYKPQSVKQARKAMFYVARGVFNGLVADSQVGKPYKMSVEFETGPKKRKRDKDMEASEFDNDEPDPRYQFNAKTAFGIMYEIVKEAVKTGKGSANIELFGKVMSVFTNDGKEMHYEVTPNTVWTV